MKINKYNESNNWTINKFESIKKDIDTIETLSLQYLKYIEFPNIKDVEKLDFKLVNFWFSDDHTRYFNAEFKHNKHSSLDFFCVLNKNEYQNLLNFMNNPSIFKKSKKYNL